jgi:hypothetical protein
VTSARNAINFPIAAAIGESDGSILKEKEF